MTISKRGHEWPRDTRQMGSRAIYWSIVVTVLAIVGITFWARGYPARVTVINNSGAEITNVTIESGAQRATIPSIANGAAASVALESGSDVAIHFASTQWRSSTRLGAARGVVIYIYPDGHIEERSKIGRMAR